MAINYSRLRLGRLVFDFDFHLQMLTFFRSVASKAYREQGKHPSKNTRSYRGKGCTGFPYPARLDEVSENKSGIFKQRPVRLNEVSENKSVIL